jgi:cytochrome P450
MSAGVETTARTMFWTAYLLAQVPQAQAAIRAELRRFPPEAVGAMQDLQHWPMLRAVILETMRLYPPASVISRVAAHDHALLGLPVRAGSLVMISPWVMHRHHRLWDSPLAFDPRRFAGNPQAYLSLPGYLPFGAGPRACLGAAFALTEASILLAFLLARFEISIEGDRPVLPVAILSTTPDREPLFRLRPVS